MTKHHCDKESCCHCHEHGHEKEGGGVKKIIRLCAAGLLLAAAYVLQKRGLSLPLYLSFYLAAYLLAGADVLFSALKSLFSGSVFTESLLMSIATVGAIVIGDYPEAVFVMLFFQAGELLSDAAVGRSQRSIRALMDIRPDHATVLREGRELSLSPEEVEVGELILVRPGERIPLDGEITSGAAAVDTSALTGESLPRDLAAGDSVSGGCIDINGLLTLRVTKPYGQSAVARILELAQNAAKNKARSEKFITRFSRIYTPAVVGAAAALAFVPLLFGGALSDWGYRALVFLVASCPCALVVSVPLTFFSGIGGAAKDGILIKGSGAVEALSRARLAVFDKTGTLTTGDFEVTGVFAQGISKEELLSLTAAVEARSNHPAARSILRAFGSAPDLSALSDYEELPGLGVRARIGKDEIVCGNARALAACGLCVTESGTVVHVARNGEYLGYIAISDTLKPDAPVAIAGLRARGIKTALLTGDNEDAGKLAAKSLDMDEYRAKLLPGGKVEAMEELSKKYPGGSLFCGDGINDAPVITRADVGVAMGAFGSDAAMEAADVVIMSDSPERVPAAIDRSRRTISIVRQNVIFALAVKAAVLALGAAGIAPMALAVFADVGVTLLAVLNALRAYGKRR